MPVYRFRIFNRLKDFLSQRWRRTPMADNERRKPGRKKPAPKKINPGSGVPVPGLDALLALGYYDGERIGAMAESQEIIPYDASMIAALETNLSAPRFAPYLVAAKGNQKQAVHLYLWNSRLAKAFLFPLNIAEVSIRNAMNEAIGDEFADPNWVLAPPFSLTPESERARLRALGRLSSSASADELVAALSFDFWSNLFRQQYHGLWSLPGLLEKVFPRLPAGENQATVQVRVASINKLRNRIAHHEPIHTYDHRKHYLEIVDLIDHRSAITADWVKRCSTIMEVVRTPPSLQGSLPGLGLTTANLRPPASIAATTSVALALPQIVSGRPALAIVTGAGQGHAVVTAARLMSYVSLAAASVGGMVDLNDHTLAQVLTDTPDIPVATIDASASTGDALALFFPRNTPQAQRPQVLLVMASNGVQGAIVHPHVRF